LTETPGKAHKKGFDQPQGIHEQWHTDIAYLNILGTHHFFLSVLDGYSRAIMHHEVRLDMTTTDVEIVMERALAHLPAGAPKPRLISDNGPQYISAQFKSYLRERDVSHSRARARHPESNGKIERFHPLAKTGDYRNYDRGSCRTCVRCTDECAGGRSPFIFTHATLAHFGAHRHTYTSSNADTDRCAINNAPARPNTNAHRAADVRGGPAVATAASTDGRDNSAVAAALADSHLHCVACSRAHSRPDAPPDTTGDYAGDCSRGNGQRDTQVGC